MLKTHGDNNKKLPWSTGNCTALESRSPEALSDYDGTDKGDLTIVGELNKLASRAPPWAATSPASTSARTATRGWRSVSRLPFST